MSSVIGPDRISERRGIWAALGSLSILRKKYGSALSMQFTGVIGLILCLATIINGATVVQRAGEKQLTLEPELAELIDLSGSGSHFIVDSAQQSVGSDGLVLVATPGANGNASSAGTKAQFQVRFATPGEYQLYFRAAAVSGVPVASADSFYLFDDWGSTGEAVQENESGLRNREYGWFWANSFAAIEVHASDIGQDLTFSIANRESGLVLDKLVLLRAPTTPTSEELDACNSPVEIFPGATLLKPLHQRFIEKVNFGHAIGLHDELAIVSALGDRSEREDGSVYVFNARTGVQQVRIEDTSPNAMATGVEYAQFGRSVALSGGLALIASGVHFDIENYQNHAFLYDALTGIFLRELIPAGTAKPMNNFSVDMDGELAIIGASHATDIDTAENTEAGAAFVFGVPSGEQMQLLRAPDGHPWDGFGESVALNEGFALVGAPSVDDDGFAGAAYLFHAQTGQLLSKLIPSVRSRSDRFGAAVALEGEIVVVGAPFLSFPPYASDEPHGAVSVFNRTTGNELFRLTAKEPAAGAGFGASVSVSNGRILIGSPSSCSGFGPSSPAAYLFSATTGELLQEISPTGFDIGCFAGAVALSGSRALVGSEEYFSGSAYLFDSLERGPFREVAGLVAIEAEHFDSATSASGHSWSSSLVQPGFAGVSAMRSLPNSGTTIVSDAALQSPALSYLVAFSRGGTFNFWVRGWAGNSSDDSVYIGVDGKVSQTLPYSATGAWMWRAKTVSISGPGVHSINIWMREDGAFVDKVALASDLNFTPVGEGPSESSR